MHSISNSNACCSVFFTHGVCVCVNVCVCV